MYRNVSPENSPAATMLRTAHAGLNGRYIHMNMALNREKIQFYTKIKPNDRVPMPQAWERFGGSFCKGEKLHLDIYAGKIIAFRNVHLIGELDFLTLMPVISIVAAKARSKFWDLLM